MKRPLPSIFLAFAALLGACSSGDTNQCTPGQSVACVGPAGCTGYQVCKADGASFEACVCGSSPTTGATTSATSAATSTSTGVGGGASSASTSASTGSGGSGGAAGFTPADLPGLALWLNTDVGVVMSAQSPGHMVRWLDQSGNGNTAGDTISMPAPEWVIDPAAVNGHDAIQCNDLFIDDAASLRWGTGDFAIAMVVKGDPFANAPERFYEKSNGAQGNPIEFMFRPGGAFELDVGPSKIGMVPQDPTKFHAIVARGQKLDMALEGFTVTGPAANVDVDNTGSRVALCVGSFAGPNVEMAEIVAVKGTLTDASLTKLQAYFHDKYGL